jgi:hypothetical protein
VDASTAAVLGVACLTFIAAAVSAVYGWRTFREARVATRAEMLARELERLAIASECVAAVARAGETRGYEAKNDALRVALDRLTVAAFALPRLPDDVAELMAVNPAAQPPQWPTPKQCEAAQHALLDVVDTTRLLLDRLTPA